jgi:hypothetical protein
MGGPWNAVIPSPEFWFSGFVLSVQSARQMIVSKSAIWNSCWHFQLGIFPKKRKVELESDRCLGELKEFDRRPKI